MARTPGRYGEIQIYMDQALNSDKPLKLTFEDERRANQFRSRFYKKRNDWKKEFLKRNGNLTRGALDPENLRDVDPDLLRQIREANPDMKHVKNYHWQSPYEYICAMQPEKERNVIIMFNSMFANEPSTSIIKVEFME